jgi:hypothetical protein
MGVVQTVVQNISMLNELALANVLYALVRSSLELILDQYLQLMTTQ